MQRFLLGVGLMVMLLAVGLGVWKASEMIHLPVAQELEQAAEEAASGRTDRAMEMALAARSRWETWWHGTAAFSDHAPMDEIDSLFAQLESSGGTELSALCRRIASLVHAITEAHSLTWWNVL